MDEPNNAETFERLINIHQSRMLFIEQTAIEMFE